MIKNYWKIAWRTITRNKLYTAINVLGLSLGVCGCLVLYLITSYEFSFDKHHPDGDRIYRIVGKAQRGASGEEVFLNSPLGDLAEFQTQVPGFEAKGAIYDDDGRISIPVAGQKAKDFDNHIPGSLYMHSAIYTWPGYFDVFHYDWVEGEAKALDAPNKVILTTSRGKLYFGDIHYSSMIGKTVLYNDSVPVTVAGIVKDQAGNTDLGFTDFLSITTATHTFLRQDHPVADWSILSPHQSMAFVKLAPGVTPEQIDARFAGLVKTHGKFSFGINKLTMYLQPLSGLHFTPDFHRGDDGDGWRKPYLPTLYTMMGVALFILLIAAVNFINLSTAQSMSRAKEVGVRKVMGSRKGNIRVQFLVETLLLTSTAVVLAILLVNPVLALFRDYIPQGVEFHVFDLSAILFLVSMTGLTTLLAGFYPAWVLSGYLPVLSLKGAPALGGAEKVGLRRTLIVFQFTISIVFIIGALVIGKQIAYMNESDKGFNTDRVLTITDWGNTADKLQVFANAIKTMPGVEKTILQGTPPMGYAQNAALFTFEPGETATHLISAHMGNEEFIPFYGMRLVAGRNMLHSDSLREVVINETLAGQMGCKTPEDALGRMLYEARGQGAGKAVPIVGVVADFHVGSFHDPIPPAVIENVPERKKSIAIKIASSEKDIKAVKALMAGIQKEWKREFPDGHIQPFFLDEEITWLFDQEKKTAWLVNMAMGVTIAISCLGLFGLGLFTTRRRAKEIGIRKVLGASVSAITALLSRDFALLVGIAFCIAAPLAGWLSHLWLADFVYRTALSWWLFAVAGFCGLGIALLTIGFQAVRAARANPVEALRSE